MVHFKQVHVSLCVFICPVQFQPAYKKYCVCVCVCVYIYTHTHTHTHIQGVPGGMCQTLGECSLC